MYRINIGKRTEIQLHIHLICAVYGRLLRLLGEEQQEREDEHGDDGAEGGGVGSDRRRHQEAERERLQQHAEQQQRQGDAAAAERGPAVKRQFPYGVIRKLYLVKQVSFFSPCGDPFLPGPPSPVGAVAELLPYPAPAAAPFLAQLHFFLQRSVERKGYDRITSNIPTRPDTVVTQADDDAPPEAAAAAAPPKCCWCCS